MFTEREEVIRLNQIGQTVEREGASLELELFIKSIRDLPTIDGQPIQVFQMDFFGWLVPSMIPPINDLIISWMNASGAKYMVADVTHLQGISRLIKDYLDADDRDVFLEVNNFSAGIIVISRSTHRQALVPLLPVDKVIGIPDGIMRAASVGTLKFFTSFIMQKRLETVQRSFYIKDTVDQAETLIRFKNTPVSN